ncbi:polar amino acid transport system substrate-binding protein [Mariprofundus micogutta]|uniref:histidine kinase n=1 Tax=Mariprofundus micogutta TaxID=1921010 RepID=A0A1L8CMH1_9PROT|nr:transporter substrate-binding domain-containing protein [Mariprofundus micogutta]GAV20120.1 polar amino acid transport system substrate-binding protein [Mariprofundus micogutta]
MKLRSWLFLFIIMACSSPALAAVGAGKILKVAIDAEYPPYEFISENGQVHGYNHDVLLALEPILHVTFQFMPMAWPSAVKSLESGSVDLVSMIAAPERKHLYEFSNPHSKIYQALFINRVSSLTGLEDLAGHKIAFQKNDISLLHFRHRNDIEKVIVSSKEEGFTLLQKGVIAGFFAADKAGSTHITEHGFNHFLIEKSAGGLFEQPFAFAAKKGRSKLISEINRGLILLEQSSAIDVLKQKWLMEKPSIWHDHKPSIIFFLSILICVLIIVIILKQLLSKRTRQLAITNKRYRSLYNDSPIPFCTMDMHGKILLVNKAWLDLLEWPENQIVGLYFKDLIPEFELDAFTSKFDKFIREKQIKHCPCTLITKSEKILDVIIDGRVLHRSQNEVHCSIQDVTVAKAAERERNKLLTAIDKSAEAIVITSPNGSIEFINHAFTEITGYSSDEAIGQNPRILKSGNQGDDYYEKMWEDLLLNSKWQGRITNRKKDGSFYPALLTIAAVKNKSGDTVNYIGIQQDMSQQEKLEEQFHQAQKMEALGTLVGGIAHDFNNSLAAISGNVFLAQQILHDHEAVHSRLDVIQQSVDHSASIIRQLLSFSRKGMGESSETSILPFLKEFEKFYETLLPENISLSLSFNLDEEQAMVDVNLFQQALNNVVNNAVYAAAHASDSEPRVTINACIVDKSERFLRQQEATERFYIKISVSDNGNGIEERDMPFVFDPFYTTKPEGSGSGLGLSMVYGMITSHHGFIDIDSVVNQGTTCSLYLPMLEEKTETHPAKIRKLFRGNGELILLVDDQHVILQTTGDMLKSLNYKVITADDGIMGFETFEKHRNEIALVVSDIVMPKMGGIEMARRIKKLRPETKVIFVSGYSTEQIGNKIPPAVKNCPIVSKPFKISELSEIIKNELLDD